MVPGSAGEPAPGGPISFSGAGRTLEPANQTFTSGLRRLGKGPSGETSDRWCVAATPNAPWPTERERMEGQPTANEDNGLTRLATVVYVPISACRAYSGGLVNPRNRTGASPGLRKRLSVDPVQVRDPRHQSEEHDQHKQRGERHDDARRLESTGIREHRLRKSAGGVSQAPRGAA